AYRPLPVVPRLHDDLSVRRELHAPCRSGPGPDRTGLHQADTRAAVAMGAGAGAARSQTVPSEHVASTARAALCSAAAGTDGPFGHAFAVAAHQGDAGACPWRLARAWTRRRQHLRRPWSAPWTGC